MRFSSVYIYVDGSDLGDVAPFLLDQMNTWQRHTGAAITVVNDIYPKTPDMESDDLPDWNLGLNIERSNLSLDMLESVVEFLFDLAVATKRDFILGYYDSKSGISEDIMFFGHESGSKPTAQIAWDCLGCNS